MSKQAVYDKWHKRNNTILNRSMPISIRYKGERYYPKWHKNPDNSFSLDFYNGNYDVFIGATGDTRKYVRAEILAGLEVMRNDGVNFTKEWRYL